MVKKITLHTLIEGIPFTGCLYLWDVITKQGKTGMATKQRGDRVGPHQRIYQRNRKRILMSQSICAICGRPVDMELKAPDPMSPTVDHIIPLNKGGHPSDINNLQLAHWICNRMKSDKVIAIANTNNNTKQKIKCSADWKNFGKNNNT